jgi:hypothetical protein
MENTLLSYLLTGLLRAWTLISLMPFATEKSHCFLFIKFKRQMLFALCAECHPDFYSMLLMSHSTSFFLAFIRLHERLQECNGDEVLKAEAGAKVQKFTEWALKCIGFHSRCQGNKDRVSHSSAVEIQLQLSAFKTFLDLVGNQLTGKDFTEAFDAACFPLTLFSSSFDPGWASGISATAIQGLLGMLVEGGADNVNQCFPRSLTFWEYRTCAHFIAGISNTMFIFHEDV